MTTRVFGAVAPDATEIFLTDGTSVEDAINSGGESAPAPLKVAVIGDSLSTENALQEHAWPSLLQKYVNGSNGNIRVQNYSINSLTFKKANEEAWFGTETPREALIAGVPQVVLCTLGLVDAEANELGRPIADIEADALAFYAAVRTALPDAIICQIRHRTFDSSINANASALTNKDVIPYFMNLRSTGILAGAYCSEILDDSISTAQQTRFDEAEQLYVYIDGLTQTDFIFDLDFWKISRAGLLGPDQLHPATTGKVMMCGYVASALIDNEIDTDWGRLGDNKNYPTWYDPDALLDTIMDPNSDWDFVPGRGGPDHALNLTSLYKDAAPSVWYLPYKTSVSIDRDTYDAQQPFHISIANGPASLPVLPSVDGGAFDTGLPTLTLTNSGCGSVSLVSPIAPGTYVFRYKCGDEIYGPYTFTFNEPVPLAVSSGGTGADNATDARDNLGIVEGVDAYTKVESDARYLLESNNLSDLTNDSVARSNLGVAAPTKLTPTFNTGWANESTNTYKDIAYYRDYTGRVFLEGCAQRNSGTDTIMFTLPVGYRPSSGVGFVHALQGQPAVMLVNAVGTVEIAGYTTNGDLAFLDGINFVAG